MTGQGNPKVTWPVPQCWHLRSFHRLAPFRGQGRMPCARIGRMGHNGTGKDFQTARRARGQWVSCQLLQVDIMLVSSWYHWYFQVWHAWFEHGWTSLEFLCTHRTCFWWPSCPCSAQHRSSITPHEMPAFRRPVKPQNWRATWLVRPAANQSREQSRFPKSRSPKS